MEMKIDLYEINKINIICILIFEEMKIIKEKK